MTFGAVLLAMGYRGDILGKILHYDGNIWSEMTSAITYDSLYGIWGSSATSVFAVGSSRIDSQWDKITGTILYYDGHSWTTVTSD